jgi:hypothetical protein
MRPNARTQRTAHARKLKPQSSGSSFYGAIIATRVDSFRLALRLGLALSLGFRFRLGLHAFRKLSASRLAIPLFESLIGDLAFDQEFGELSPLCLTLKWHFTPFRLAANRHRK